MFLFNVITVFIIKQLVEDSSHKLLLVYLILYNYGL